MQKESGSKPVPMPRRYPVPTKSIWQEFRREGTAASAASTIEAHVTLTQPARELRQFAVTTGSGHHFLVDDREGATGPKPIELVAAALAGCTAFDVITILRKKFHQRITSYEVHVEAEQSERPPQVFVAIRVHHAVRGQDIEAAAVAEAIRISEEKYCSVEAMLKSTAVINTTYEITEETGENVAEKEPAASAI